jgi:hypothetical protein
VATSGVRRLITASIVTLLVSATMAAGARMSWSSEHLAAAEASFSGADSSPHNTIWG